MRVGSRVRPAGTSIEADDTAGGNGAIRAPESAPILIRLLDSFGLIVDGRSVELAPTAQRLLAFLALRGGVCPRISAATALWPGAAQELANAALRSALWRLRRAAPGVVSATPTELTLPAGARVDAGVMRDLARRLVHPEVGIDTAELDIAGLVGTLLPGWYDDWVLYEREQLHQLQLHGLQALAERLLDRGSHALAAEAALATIRLDPLRESPHRLLVRVHLDEGNVSEALRFYADYRRLLRDELGVAPSARFAELVGALVGGRIREPSQGTPR